MSRTSPYRITRRLFLDAYSYDVWYSHPSGQDEWVGVARPTGDGYYWDGCGVRFPGVHPLRRCLLKAIKLHRTDQRQQAEIATAILRKSA
jgi:hypothetical protein